MGHCREKGALGLKLLHLWENLENGGKELNPAWLADDLRAVTSARRPLPGCSGG